MTDNAVESEGVKLQTPSRVDPEFKHEVLSMHGGETLKYCFQCGTCTSCCPIADITDSYRPRTAIRLAQLGLEERLLSSDTIWLCAACYTCTDHCPQGVEVKDVLRVFQNLAVKKGYIPRVYREVGKNILSAGYAHKISKFKMKKRIAIGLPPLSEAPPAQMEKLAKATSFHETIAEKEDKE
jgi:heterodisulfide reductase subunit C